MQPALACPGIGTSPPLWTAALLPLDWRLAAFPLLALLIYVGLNALLMRRVPDEAQGVINVWLCIAAIFLFAAVISITFLNVVLDGSWANMLLQWHDEVMNRPGFLDCQFTELDKKYYGASLIDDYAIRAYEISMLGLSIVWGKAIKVAQSATDKLKAELSPDIPGVR